MTCCRYAMQVPGWSDEVYYSWEGESEHPFQQRVLRSLVERFPGALSVGSQIWTRTEIHNIHGRWSRTEEATFTRRRVNRLTNR